MRVILPKASRGFVFDRLFKVEMNDFDVERLLPSLFYLVVTRGRLRGSRGNDPKSYERYLDALLAHPRLEGFGDEAGRRLLDRWVRSSVVRMGRVGRARRDEQIEFVLPLTLLAYKPGFPAEIRRQRNVHVFLYKILVEFLRTLDVRPSPEALLNAIFQQAFGRGVVIGGGPRYDGAYDGKTEVDIHTLLCLCYLDGFQATEVSARKDLSSEPGPALPGVADRVGADVLRYLLAYRDLMPSLALTRGLLALVNFELFHYTIRLIYAANALVRNRTGMQQLQDQQTGNAPELYVDFTRDRGGASDELSRACVDRDLEELRVFYESALWLRTVHRFVQFHPQFAERLKGLDTPGYLQSLVGLKGDPRIEARAQAELEAIMNETLEAIDSSVERNEAEVFFSEVLRQAEGNALDASVKLLAEAQRKNAIEAYVKWYWSVGGLRKPYGLLAGNTRGRRNWRYAMSDDLLALVMQLALVEDPSGTLSNVTVRPRMRLREFLQFLESRFGVIVDRPPAFLDTPSTRGAAQENLEALKRRLRQMGYFQALSDDFTTQYLRTPAYREAS